MQFQVGIVMLVEINIAFSVDFNLHFTRVKIAAGMAIENWCVFEEIEESGRCDVRIVPFDPAHLAWGELCPMVKGFRRRLEQAQGQGWLVSVKLAVCVSVAVNFNVPFHPIREAVCLEPAAPNGELKIRDSHHGDVRRTPGDD